MTPVPVIAAWCIPITKANFRAAYGRVADNDFTKDYFQIPGSAYADTLRLLMNGETEDASIEYVWPGGSVSGAIRKAKDERRLRLSWPYGDAPKPWKPTQTPSATTVETFPGDPDVFVGVGNAAAATAAAATANAQYVSAQGAGINAWAVAVQLEGEEGRLHTRMYLQDPPIGYEWASTELLPSPLQELIASGGASVRLYVFEWPVRAPSVVGQILEALEDGPNVLLTGPPGTGKTVALEDLRSLVEHAGDRWLFDETALHDGWSLGRRRAPLSKVVSLVFHPGYSYENFVLGVLPSPTVAGGIDVVPGPLLELGHYAEAEGHQGLLIIDEFNRGRAAAIFGDTLALLDADKRSRPGDAQGARIARRYPTQTAQVSSDYRVNSSDNGVLPSYMSLPQSLSIVAAMNSSDRSVAVLDSAMRRRFSIIDVRPDYNALAKHYGVTRTAGLPAVPTSDIDVKLLALRLLESLNRRIQAVASPDYELGQALVWRVSGGSFASAMVSLSRAVDHRIIPTLRMSFRDEVDVLGAILRATDASGATPDSSRFVSWVDAPADLEQYAPRSLYVTRLSDAPIDDRWGLVASLVE